MKTTINQRFEMLRNHLNLTQQGFSNLIGVSTGQLSRIENGKNEPEKATVNKVFTVIDVSKDWLINGKGELNAKLKESETQGVSSWKDEAYSLMKEQLQKKDELIAQLMSVVQKLNFLNALDSAAGPYVFPGEKQGTVSRAAA